MNAIYKGQLYNLGDNLNVVELTDPETGVNMTVPWGDPDLIVDPTDDQVFNLVPDEKTGGLIRLKTKEEKEEDEKPFRELGAEAKEEIQNMIRIYPVRDILDYMSEAMLGLTGEIGYEPDEQVLFDDAAIVAHAAKHVKG